MEFTNLYKKHDEIYSSVLSFMGEAGFNAIVPFIVVLLGFGFVSGIVVYLLFRDLSASRDSSWFERNYKKILAVAVLAGLIVGPLTSWAIAKSAVDGKYSLVNKYAVENIESKYDTDFIKNMSFSFDERSNKYYMDAEYVNDEANSNAQMKISFADDGEPSIMKSEVVTDDLIKTLEK